MTLAPVQFGSLQYSGETRKMKSNMSATSTDSARLKMEVFQKVRPICVQLMSIATQPVTSTSPHASLFSTLHTLTSNIPQQAFTPGLINYLLFPFTQILRTTPQPTSLSPTFLESSFRFLALIVQRWQRVEGGMDKVAWEQLWRFVIATATFSDKGKEKATSQEVHMERIKVLSALLQGSLSDEMKAGFATPKSTLMPTLFQTISYALSQVQPSPPNLQLQLSTLRLLRPCIAFLKGQHNVLASVLPGLTSSVAKLFASEGMAMKGDVAAEALGLVEEALSLTLADEDLERLGIIRKVRDLADLADAPPEGTKLGGGAGTGKDPFPPITATWLDFTSNQLVTALTPMLDMGARHQSHVTRLAGSSLSCTILTLCAESLSDTAPTALRTILLLSQDEFDLVREDAAGKLRALHDQHQDKLISLLSSAMSSLPRMITSQSDRISQQCRLITAIASIPTRERKRNAISDLLGPMGRVERWSWALLDCLEFGRPTGWSSGNAAARAAQLGWGQTMGGGLLIDSAEGEQLPGSNPTIPFPSMPFRYIESDVIAKQVGKTLEALGRAAGESALHTVNYMVLIATDPARGASALWVAERIYAGVVDGQMDDEGRVSRKVRKMAKEISRALVDLDEDEEGNGGLGEQTKEEGNSDALTVERSRGINELSTLLDKPTLKDGYIASENRRLAAEAHKILLTCRSLSLLTLCARTLSSSFRPLLLHSLYFVLSHLASPHLIIRTHAELCLSHIAYHTNYASPRNLIIDNVDYVINVVSQRLTHARLAIHAPLVLIAMIRLVGSEIVPLVQDVVDEIFDALDDYHGYEVLTSSLLAVLVALVQSMKEDKIAEGMSEEREGRMKEMRRVDVGPEPERDFGGFKAWYEGRKRRREEDVEEVLQRPAGYWPAAEKGDTGDSTENAKMEEEVPENGDPTDDSEIPLTRAQEACKEILNKSTYFLTHPSAFLRSKVLSLIAAAIPVLARDNREGDLLPIIDKAWSGIIGRLKDEEGYVVTEAAEVIASLSEHVGDFMGRRILDHAWPAFRDLINKRRASDRSSALARRGGAPQHSTPTQQQQTFGTGPHTYSHRLHLAILQTMKFVADEVPVDDGVLWEMMLLFRPFLDRRTHEEVQGLASEVFISMKKRDGDAVWVVLSATRGRREAGDVWRWMADDGLDIELNAEIILGQEPE